MAGSNYPEMPKSSERAQIHPHIQDDERRRPNYFPFPGPSRRRRLDSKERVLTPRATTRLDIGLTHYLLHAPLPASTDAGTYLLYYGGLLGPCHARLASCNPRQPSHPLFARRSTLGDRSCFSSWEIGDVFAYNRTQKI